VTIDRSQRWRRDWPCPVCGGYPELPQGYGIRCAGFLSSDGKYAHCSREERASDIAATTSGAVVTFAHVVDGAVIGRDGEPVECRCGARHVVGVASLPVPRSLPVPSPVPAAAQPSPVIRRQRWEIHDLNGRTVAIHERRDRADGSKGFVWLHPDGRPSSTADPLPVAPTDMLYGLPWLAVASPKAPVLIVEGEKAADAVAGLGIPNLPVLGVVCGAHTAPSAGALAPLRGRRVYLWPDLDEPGVRLMRTVADRLRELGAASVHTITWAASPPKGDAADFVARGGTGAQLIDMAKSAVPALSVVQPKDDDPTFSWDTVTLRDMEFVWKPRIPRRKVTILAGMPNAGKTMLSLAIAAGITVGDGLPERDACSPGSVLYCSLEDDIDDTLGPRIEAMGGRRSRMWSIRKAISFNRSGLAVLDDVLRRRRFDLVVFDTLSAFVTGEVSMNAANEMRQVFTGLRQRCVDHDLAIMLLTHLNKGVGTEALMRILGSVDIVGAARSIMFAGTDPEDHRIGHLLHVKHNNSRKACGLRYRIQENPGDPDRASFLWDGVSDITEERLLAAKGSTADPAVKSAAEMIRVMLSAGPQEGRGTREMLRQQGVSASFISAACNEAGVTFVNDTNGVLMWVLREHLSAEAAS
jgi:AAA domain